MIATGTLWLVGTILAGGFIVGAIVGWWLVIRSMERIWRL